MTARLFSFADVTEGASVPMTVVDGVEYMCVLSVIKVLYEYKGDDFRQASCTWKRYIDKAKKDCGIIETRFFGKHGRRYYRPAVTLSGAIKLTMLLEGTGPKKYKTKFADIITRYMAGDQSMIEEMQCNAVSDEPLARMARADLAREGQTALENAGTGAEGGAVGSAEAGAPGAMVDVESEDDDFGGIVCEDDDFYHQLARKRKQNEIDLLSFMTAKEYEIVKLKCGGKRDICREETGTDIEMMERKSDVWTVKEDLVDTETRVTVKEYDQKQLFAERELSLKKLNEDAELESKKKRLEIQKEMDAAELEKSRKKAEAELEMSRKKDEAELEMSKKEDEADLEITKRRHAEEIDFLKAKEGVALEALKGKQAIEQEGWQKECEHLSKKLGLIQAIRAAEAAPAPSQGCVVPAPSQPGVISAQVVAVMDDFVPGVPIAQAVPAGEGGGADERQGTTESDSYQSDTESESSVDEASAPPLVSCNITVQQPAPAGPPKRNRGKRHMGARLRVNNPLTVRSVAEEYGYVLDRGQKRHVGGLAQDLYKEKFDADPPSDHNARHYPENFKADILKLIQLVLKTPAGHVGGQATGH